MTKNERVRLTYGILFLLGMAIFMVGRFHYRQMVYVGMRVNLVDKNNYLVDSNMVKRQVVRILGHRVEGTKIKDLNLQKVETELQKLPYIKHVEAYNDRYGILNIDILQARPVVKVITSQGTFYIDKDRTVYRASIGHPYYTVVANGAINLDTIPYGKRVDTGVIADLYELASYINKNAFWRSNIVQIYVRRDGQYELIPRVGGFRIVFGTLDDFEKKFRNLYAFYKYLPRLGWNKYSEINLSYRNQIVAVKNNK